MSSVNATSYYPCKRLKVCGPQPIFLSCKQALTFYNVVINRILLKIETSALNPHLLNR